MAESIEVKVEAQREATALALVPYSVQAPTQIDAPAPTPAPAPAPAPAPTPAPAPASASASASDPSPSPATGSGPALAASGFNLNSTPQAEDHTLAPAAAEQTQDLAPTNSPATPTEACTAYRVAEHLRHKNRLQEYTQKASLHYPLYQTINEGPNHSPRFRSTVIVDGERYTSPNTCSNRKTAEQEVAKFALESITKKIEEEGCSLIREDTVLCKSILYEFAMKVNAGMPVYTTYQLNGRNPVFKSSLVFDGVLYKGKFSSNKKEAEQLAAREVIFSLLGTSGLRTILFEIIKSKVKFLSALHRGGEEPVETGTTNYNMTMSAVQGANSGISVPPVETTTTNYNVPTVPVQGANPGISLHPHHLFSTPGPEPSGASLNLPIQFIGPSSGTKRRKNKKKANKKLHTDSQLVIAPQAFSQGPACSVAQ